MGAGWGGGQGPANGTAAGLLGEALRLWGVGALGGHYGPKAAH